MTAKPPYADDWDGLLAVARRLQAQRAAVDPHLVERGKLAPADATNRARLSAALVALWTHVVDRSTFAIYQPVEALGAPYAELRNDVAAAIERATAAAAKAPADRTLDQIAAGLRAIAWQLRSMGDPVWGLPHIVAIHDINRQARALYVRAPRKAA